MEKETKNKIKEKIEKKKNNNKNTINNNNNNNNNNNKSISISYTINLIIGILIILIDQLTKHLLIKKSIPIIPNFLTLDYTENRGGAFGIGNISFVTIFSILIVIVIIAILIKEKKKISNLIPFTLVLSGSIGNLIDRIFRGHVIDYININLFDFPNFNIADICIVIGVFLLLYIYVIKPIIEDKNKS